MEQAQAIAAAVFGSEPLQVTPIVGKGAVNQVFLLTHGARRAVLRLPSPDDLHRAAAFYAKERWCLDQAAAVGVPSPQVLAQGEHEGWPYQVLSFVEGVTGKESALPRATLWQALGRYARRFHQVALTGFGETLPEFFATDGRARWQGFLDYNLASLTDDDPLLTLGVYQPAHQPFLRDCFTGLRALTAPIGLCHGDLSRRNLLVGPGGAITLLDWGCAEAHLVPHYELVAWELFYPAEDERFTAFCDGYELSATERATLLVEARDLALVKAFDLVRWAIDRCPARIDELAAKARAHREARF